MKEQSHPQKNHEAQGALAATPDNFLLIALQNGSSVDALEKLMTLKERWDAKIAKVEFLKALSKFQSECPALKKTAKVNYPSKAGNVSYTFTPLGDILNQIQQTLFANGLTVQWRISEESEQIKVGCVVSHIAGHSEETSMIAPSDKSGSKNDIQAKGSTITYLQRYTLASILGLRGIDTDNDGNHQGAENKKELPGIDGERFVKALKALKDGKTTVEGITSRYALTEEQSVALAEAKNEIANEAGNTK